MYMPSRHPQCHSYCSVLLDRDLKLLLCAGRFVACLHVRGFGCQGQDGSGQLPGKGCSSIDHCSTQASSLDYGIMLKGLVPSAALSMVLGECKKQD